MGIVKVGGAARHREVQNEMECSRMGGNVSQAAAWAFWGVRSKQCFRFILVGGVLFKVYFNFGECASLPLMRIPRDWYSLRNVLFCLCDPQGPPPGGPQLRVQPSPWDSQLPPCFSWRLLLWSSLCVLALLAYLLGGCLRAALHYPRNHRLPTPYFLPDEFC